MLEGWPRSARYWLWCGLLIVALLLGAELVVPRFISAAYRGESLDVLNRILAEREQHSLDHYLSLWGRLSRFAIAGLAALLGFVAIWRWKIGALVDRIVGAEPDLPPRDVIWVSAWFGVVAGFGEAAPNTVRYLIRRDPALLFTWESVWMAPLASMLAFLFVGILVLAVARASSRNRHRMAPAAIKTTVFAFGGFAAYGVLSQPALRLANYAAVILSLGLAAALARWSVRTDAGFMRVVRKTSIPIAILLLFSSAVGVWTLPTPQEQRRLASLVASADQPNVLLIILDTLRASSMSLYGYERETTPNLDRFAAGGVVFDRAIATSPWTLPSHASMFTGRYPYEMSADIGMPLDRTHPTLAEVLASEGYATAAFVANYAYTTESSGLARGFARYEDFPIHAGRFFRSSWLAEAIVAGPAKLAHPRNRKRAEMVTDDFLRWLAGRPDRPFFVFLNYIDPHYPYVSPPPFNTMFSTPGQPPKLAESDKREGISFEELEGSRSAYDNAIAYTDAHVGRLFGELERMGILDNTIVVVTSDHGEHLGEHGLQYHSNSLYMPLLHVPLLIVYPPGVPRGSRVADPVTIRDIPKTLLELAGMTSDDKLAGSSLSRRWATPDSVRPAADPILSEVRLMRDRDFIRPWDPVYRGAMKSLVLGDLHYIRIGSQEDEVFDFVRDPDELSDLSDTLERERLLGLRSALDSIIRLP